MQLPSALSVTIATEVVGATHALKPIASPRPRRTGPAPRSNGCAQSISASMRSSTLPSAASCMTVPVACGRPSRSRFCRRNASGSSFSARAIMSVWLS